jgi:hypothetical protein
VAAQSSPLQSLRIIWGPAVRPTPYQGQCLPVEWRRPNAKSAYFWRMIFSGRFSLHESSEIYTPLSPRWFSRQAVPMCATLPWSQNGARAGLSFGEQVFGATAGHMRPERLSFELLHSVVMPSCSPAAGNGNLAVLRGFTKIRMSHNSREEEPRDRGGLHHPPALCPRTGIEAPQ